MYRRGIISAVDVGTCRARCKFPDHDGVESYWLDVLQPNAGQNKDKRLPDLGEQVACMLDENGEQGCVVGALYTGETQPPEGGQDQRRVVFSDGTVVQYDRASHVLRIEIDSGEVQVDVDSVKVRGAAEFVALATKVFNALNTLKAAISGAPTTAGDGGAAFKGGILAALAAWPPSVASEVLESD